jgi:uncharacterized protein YbaP (TraB family)
MKKILLSVLVLSSFLLCRAQTKSNSTKYPSLFWEITGNGLSRPSYLFGTMHVSSKMVFHLPDSFYLGIKNVDVVALETNPESWQEDLVKYEVDANSYRSFRYLMNNFRQMPDDYLNIRTLQFNKYEKLIEAALYSRPSTINNLLYRNYSDYSSDFEENTYLDMYIYQVGKKMGKRVAGVEKYDESMKLMMEAYRDAAKDKTRKQRSYDDDDTYSADKLQEAYRTGNLDLLDSINHLNSFSDAFDEKFLYSRNFLQANSIDSILKTKSSLFVGVGAAHLPGTRGVIEILRRKGYKLRPILMRERDSRQKDMVEKLRVPVNFTTQASEDEFFKCDIPGKFYRFNEEGLLDQLQYADMANGSYYMVTRIKTNSQFWGHNEDIVKKKIDSLLYENIPGKILNKLEILRNGYKGLDIMNRTRRGDIQRYNIFITPYEVIIFKMSGNGDYVKDGEEAKKFFGSIQLKEYKVDPVTAWKKYQSSWGGFSVDFPHEPFISKSGNWQYEAKDKISGTNYSVLRTDIHNYSFAEEDTFDLGLLDESFSSSEFIEEQLSRKQIIWKGYQALDCKYLHKDGSVFLVRFIIQGPHYFTLVAHGKRESPSMQNFLNSFEIKPFVYREPFEKKDTSLYYTVTTSFYPEDKKIKLTIPGNDNSSLYSADSDDDDDDENNLSNWGSFKSNIIENDSTGEKIYVSFYKNGRYYYNDDSSGLTKNRITRNGSWIIRSEKKIEKPNNWRINEWQLSDTNSSRLIWTKSFYKNGIGFFLVAEGDTITGPSSFVKSYFETFVPFDTLKGFNPFEKKSTAFFNDFFSSDTTIHKRAVKAINQLRLDSTDFPQLKKAIYSVKWSDKKYLETKKSLINKLGDINSKSSSDFLKELYYAAGDTVEIQYAVLESLLQQQTQYAFNVFKNIITIEPPVLESNSNSSYSDFNLNRFRFNVNSRFWNDSNYDNGDFWDELYDSVKLTRTILPDILPLLNLDDYKWRTMRLLERMIDSNLVKSQDYEIYFSKFFIEAKQELKKQAINEKKKLIKKASRKNSTDKDDDDDDVDNSNGNEKLGLYAKLLLPFWKVNSNVPVLFQQLLQSNDKKLQYNTMLMMIQNNKAVSDSLLSYFAALDEYRYTLYHDLDEIGQLKYFPTKYNNQVDLAKSKLIDSKSYGKPDSVLYINKLSTEFKSKQGYVYFFKYKEKKDDLVWKLATVGLLSKDLKQFEIRDTDQSTSAESFIDDDRSSYNNRYNFTSFTDVKLKEDEPISLQLNKLLKKMIYSRRKSAKEFYDVSKTDFDEVFPMKLRN